ncbi:MAG: HlyD family efflux transporter periplasmic adaptor subunit, partial [Planctomycetota bacterium]
SYENAIADLKQLLATEKSQKAEIESLENAVLQAKQNLREAARDLEDCTLYSSFRGQVEETFVVPGSLVAAGDPVVSLQMMDPIKVELEVSARQSRQLQRTDVLPVHVSMPDGSTEIREGFLHQIDPSADPQTRTFTLTILVLNGRLAAESETSVATTDNLWRLDLTFIPGARPGDLYIEEQAIQRDEDGYCLWQITNATIQDRSPSDRLFQVRRLPIVPTAVKVPYLGERVFQRVEIEDDAFDPAVNLVTGKLSFRGEVGDWDGKRVQLENFNRWMLRPGDLVKVDLSNPDRREGWYVPMGAISRRGAESAIFTLDSLGETASVRRVPIQVVQGDSSSTTSSLCRIEAVDGESLEDVRYVSEGAHFLIDGEEVRIVQEPMLQPDNAEQRPSLERGEG